MEQRQPTPEELKLMAFYHQLIALGPGTETAARLVILRADGTRFGSVSLASEDLDAATDVLASLNQAKKALDEGDLDGAFAEALALVEGPKPLPEPTASDVDEIVSGFEALLKDEGGQPA